MGTTIATPQRSILSKPKIKPKKRHRFLKQLHIYGKLTPQILASGVLIALILWHFVSIPSPVLRITGFTVEENRKTNITSLNYNITLQNPDLYKRILYDVLFMRINLYGVSRRKGAFVDFIGDKREALHQTPIKTTTLGNHSVDCIQGGDFWVNKTKMIVDKISIDMRFVMQFRVLFFSKVIATRQRMRKASVYLNDDGIAIIPNHSGLTFK